ncbi:alpha/beta hydrolase [Geodermatophilus sp. SYSU D00703]
MSAPSLTSLAGWDLPLLRGAVFTLDAVAERLPAWRARMEAVGRGLGDADCWYGPAAQAAAGALVEVSSVTTAVTTALEESRTQARLLLAAADTAQDLAEQALASAAAVPVTLDDAGRLTGPLPVDHGTDAGVTAAARRAEALGVDAVEAGRRADLSAAEAADALAGLGIGGGLSPATFEDLSWLVRVETPTVPPPPLPPPTLLLSASPQEAAAWWAGLSTAEREQAIARTPVLIGSLDGLPAWARDEANRRFLDEVLADPAAAGRDVAVSVTAEIAGREAAGETVQLLQFQPQQGLVALGLGDVDTADSVAVLVPGTGNEPAEDLDGLAEDAEAVADAATAAAPAASVATIAWMAYRTPPNLGAAVSTSYANTGGPALDRTLDGLAAFRAHAGGDQPRTTVIGHSYGNVVIDRAVDAPGRLAADTVVLVASPGMDNRAADLEVREVFEASSALDPVPWLMDVHGWQTDGPGFGATELPTDWDTWHTEYYNGDRPTVAAIGEVVAGTREPG